MLSDRGEAHRKYFAEKMDALARLSGGVAHEFNNLLSAILGTADLALGTSNLPESLRADLMAIREAAQRAAAVTRRLRAFSGSQALSTYPTDLSKAMEQLKPLVLQVLPKDVSLTLTLESRTSVEADPMQLEQIVLGLVMNAIEAMPRGGELTIATSDASGLPATDTHDAVAGRVSVIEVRDSGPGMDAATQAKLFEPFHSTKDAGKGAGLGLAAAYGTVRQMKGYVDIESAKGKGTSVRIAFVRTTTKERPAVAPQDRDLSGGEVVLVVEDEAIVRAPVCRTLRHHGYYVLEANNGEDALRVMQDYHSPVHLVVTDVIMPEMAGPELVALLRQWYPAMRVLFISGYSKQYLEERGGEVEGSAFLAKPFSPTLLATTVRDLLDVQRDV